MEHARNHDIYFTSLPANSTHLTQPLDVAVFRSLKSQWRRILDGWRKESRQIKGAIPKPHLPALLNQLWSLVAKSGAIGRNLKSGFRACGLLPFNPEEVLCKLPDYSSPNSSHSGSVSSGLSDALVDILRENRGQKESRKSRGKRVEAGKAVHANATAMAHSSYDEVFEELCAFQDVEIMDVELQRSGANQCNVCGKSTQTHWCECAACHKSLCAQCCVSVDHVFCSCQTCQLSDCGVANYVVL